MHNNLVYSVGLIIFVLFIRLPAGHEDDDDIISTGSHDETKSRFTEYSITSSVVPRSEGSGMDHIHLINCCTYLIKLALCLVGKK